MASGQDGLTDQGCLTGPSSGGGKHRDRTWEYFKEDWKSSKSFFLLIVVVGLGQGMMTLARLAIQYYYKDDLGVGPDKMQAAVGAAFVPWMIKPVYAFISDSSPICGYRRTPYIIICAIVSIISWLSLAFMPISFGATIVVILFCSASFAFINVVAEALIVEKSAGRQSEYAIFLLSIFWGCTAIAEAITSYWGGKLLEYFTTRQMFLITAVSPGIVLIAAPFLVERPSKLEVTSWTKVQADNNDKPGKDSGQVEKGQVVDVLSHEYYNPDPQPCCCSCGGSPDTHVLVSLEKPYRCKHEDCVKPLLFLTVDELIKHAKEAHAMELKAEDIEATKVVCGCCDVPPPKTWKEPTQPGGSSVVGNDGNTVAGFWISLESVTAAKQSWGKQVADLYEAFFIEQPIEDEHEIAEGSSQAMTIAVWKPTLYMLLWYSMPSLEGTMFFYYTNELGFSEEFMGGVELTKSMSMFVAIIAFNLIIKCPCVSGPGVLLRPALIIGTILTALASGFALVIVTRKNEDWGIPDQYFAIADTAFIMLFGTFAFFPLLALAIRLCPPLCEATVYATVMAAGNLGTFLAAQFGALLTWALGVNEHTFDNLWILVIICSVAKLLPLFFICYLTPSGDADKATAHGASLARRHHSELKREHAVQPQKKDA